MLKVLNGIALLLLLFLWSPKAVFSQSSEYGEETMQRLAKEQKYDSIISVVLNIDDAQKQPTHYTYLIYAYLAKGDNLNGLVYANKWEQVSQKAGDTHLLKKALNYKVKIYYYLKKHQKCIATALKVRDLYTENDSLTKATNDVVLGLAYSELQEFENALNVYQNINQAHVKHKSDFYNNYAIIHQGLKQYDSALHYQKKCLKLDKASNNPSYIAQSYSNIASTYLDINKPKQSITYLDSALQQKNISNTFLKEIYQNQYAAYAALKNTDSALASLQRIKKLDEVIFDKKINEELDEIKSSYQREQNLIKKVDLVDKKLNKSKQQRLWIIIIALAVLMALGAFVFILLYQKVKFQRDTIIAEQKLLRSQMTPHFIFNALSVIQGMILSQENKKAVDYLSKFSKLMRLILENSRFKLVSIEDELETIKNYLDLQSSRFENSFSYHINVDSDLDLQTLIPPMLIQPFIENALEHGFSADSTTNSLTIKLAMQANSILCTVTDNGVGIDAKKTRQNSAKKSLSTTITKERLEILAKDLKCKAGIRIEDRKKYDEKGTIVSLNIPFKTN